MKMRALVILFALLIPASASAKKWKNTPSDICLKGGNFWMYGNRYVCGVITAKHGTCVRKDRLESRCAKSGATFADCAKKNGRSQDAQCFFPAEKAKGFKCVCGPCQVFSYIKKKCVPGSGKTACVCGKAAPKAGTGSKGASGQGAGAGAKIKCPRGAIPIDKDSCNCQNPDKYFDKKKKTCRNVSYASYLVSRGGNARPRGNYVRTCTAKIRLGFHTILEMKGHGMSNKSGIQGGPQKARRSARANITQCFFHMMRGLRHPFACKFTSDWKFHGGIKRFHPKNIRKAICRAQGQGPKAINLKLEVTHPKGGSRARNCWYKKKGFGYTGTQHQAFLRPLGCPKK
jgi:hypothetical protein